MPLKKEVPNSEARDRDIELLFSRAGLTGAKYRVFPRQEAASVPAVLPEQGRVSSTSAPIVEIEAKAAAPTAPIPAPIAMRAAATTPSAWSSLERIFAGYSPGGARPQPVDRGVKVALLSVAGGVGKTTLAATLARIVSGHQRQALIGDCGYLPAIAHHFGSRGQRLGPMEFFYPAAGARALPVGTFRLPPSEMNRQDFQNMLAQVEASESLLLLDLPTLQSSATSDALACATHALVPITPDVHSIAGLVHLKQLLAATSNLERPPQAHYMINRFDESRALHHEIRARLKEQLGENLLPFVVHEDPAIPEAAANGMTIVDYRPQSPAAQDIAIVAQWLERAADEAAEIRRERGI